MAAGALGGSFLCLSAFLLVPFASLAHWWLVASVAVIVLIAYAVQVHFLCTIGSHPSARRLITWKLSLLLHGVVFLAGYAVVRHSVVFVLLVPEALSALIHLFGIHRATLAKNGA
jgi:hypothetical protein